MSGKIEISRELAQEILEKMMGDWSQIDSEWGPTKGGIEADIANGNEEEIRKLRAILAAPVVERQEPVAYIVEAIDPNNGHLRRRGLHWHSVDTLRGTRDFKEWIGENLTKEQPLYTSPPAPVAVVLPERLKLTAQKDLADPVTFDWQRGWNACLDKVKVLNQ